MLWNVQEIACPTPCFIGFGLRSQWLNTFWISRWNTHSLYEGCDLFQYYVVWPCILSTEEWMIMEQARLCEMLLDSYDLDSEGTPIDITTGMIEMVLDSQVWLLHQLDRLDECALHFFRTPQWMAGLARAVCCGCCWARTSNRCAWIDFRRRQRNATGWTCSWRLDLWHCRRLPSFAPQPCRLCIGCHCIGPLHGSS